MFYVILYPKIIKNKKKNSNIYIIFLHVCLRACMHVCDAKNAIGVASGEPGEARERIGAANTRLMNVRQTKFRQMKFAK